MSGLEPDDLVIVLISGGGSALLSLPAPGVSLDDKRALTSALLASGSPIGAINTVRKHLSAIKGGRLALATHPARVVTLAISDVPGDDPAVVASGPTIADQASGADALDLLARYRVAVPDHVRRVLDAAAPSVSTDAGMERNEFCFVATPLMALEQAADCARAAGITPVILSDAIEGEAREVAKPLVAMARRLPRPAYCFRAGRPPLPCAARDTEGAMENLS